MLRAFVEQSPAYLVILEGPELRMTYATEALSQLMGRPLVGRRFGDVLPGSPAIGIVERVFTTGVSETIRETPLFTPGAEHAERYFTRTFTPLTDRDGTVRAVAIAGYEATAEVLARRALEASE